MLLPLLLLAALPGAFPNAPQSPAPAAADAAAPRVPAVVEHGGSRALLDRLTRAAAVWHDAGDFLVGELEPSQIEVLRQRGVAVRTLEGLADDDSLFLVDLRLPLVRSALGEGARLLHAAGDQALIAVPADLRDLPEELRPGHTCHGGHLWIPRRAAVPAPVPTVDGLPVADAGGGNVALGSADPRIQVLVDGVSKTNLETWVATLAAHFSRNSTVASYIDPARDQIRGQLIALGYSPQNQTFSGSHGDNVVVEIPGLTKPDELVVIGAHYDSRNSAGSGLSAPGADDNASGSSGVLEIARLLKTAGAFERTIRLVWFAGEEYGLLGAQANAAATKSAGKTIVGMLNMDMNAWRHPSDTRDCDFAVNNTSAALTSFCDATSALYVSNWASKSGTLTAGSSDHAAYHAEGFPAVFFFEDLNSYFSGIHTSSDSYPASTTDFDLAQMIVRGVLASAATLAEPVDMAIAHTPLPDTQNASGPYPVSASVISLIGSNVTAVELHHSGDGGQTWTVAPMASQGGGSYAAAIPSYGSPVTVRYYLRALDDQGNTEALPEGADSGGSPYLFFVGTKTPLLATGFEEGNDAGWTHAQVLSQDDWQRGVPWGKSGDPSAAFAGTRVWGNDLGPSGWNGAYANQVENWLRSPVVDCSAASNVALEFQRWLTVEAGQYDQAQVRVNGQVVWQNPLANDLIDTAWVPMQIDVSAIAAGNPSVQVEFRLKSDGGVAFGGWNIDEFALVELGPGTGGCPSPATYCTAQVTSNLCVPAIAWTGTPSASGAFVVQASQIEAGQPGVLFYSTAGPSSAPFGNGTLCIQPPAIRLPPANSGGTSACTGAYAADFSAWIAAGSDPALVPGASVWLQFWFRDPGDPNGYALSDALGATVCP